MKVRTLFADLARSAYENRAIKESFDRLPSGICYFSAEGLPILCNTQMRRLALSLMGRDLQRLDELEAFLDEHQGPVTDYDEGLVRKLVERITVYDDYLAFEFKCGAEITIIL